jgi:hypothetical protein
MAVVQYGCTHNGAPSTALQQSHLSKCLAAYCGPPVLGYSCMHKIEDRLGSNPTELKSCIYKYNADIDLFWIGRDTAEVIISDQDTYVGCRIYIDNHLLV